MLALRSSAAASRGGAPQQPAEPPKAAKDEVRFCELVPMIHDWVQRSFTPMQEERLQRKGRLCARFKVDLGKKMAEHLQAYVKASFALKLLLVRVRLLESSGRRPPQEVVEVVMSPEAKSLYAEKNPEAVKKFQQQLVTVGGSTDGLVDADGDDEVDPDALAIEDGQLALKAEQDEAALAIEDGHAPASSVGFRGGSRRQVQETSGRKRRRGDGAVKPEGGDSPKKEENPPKAAASRMEAMTAAGGSTGSVWEKCEANEILPGQVGLVEAREALSDGLAKRAFGGMEAIKAEREAVSWLKGLLSIELSPKDMKETRIGVVVNDWRKHNEPYISRLATALLAAWKKSWKESEHAKRHGA